MSKHTEEGLFRGMREAEHLAQEEENTEEPSYSLEDILSEFGHGETNPVPPDTSVKESVAEDAPPEEAVDTEPSQPVDDSSVPEMEEAEETSSPQEEAATAIEDAVDNETPDQPEGYPGEPEGAEHSLSLEQVMSQTVESVLAEDDAILEPREPLTKRLATVRAAVVKGFHQLYRQLKKRKKKRLPDDVWDDEELSEPEIEQAATAEKRFCKKWRRSILYTAIPTMLLIVLSALDALVPMPAVWQEMIYLRLGVMGGLLLLAMLLAAPLWRKLITDGRQLRFGCELAAACSAVVALADCAYGMVTGQGENLPFSATAAAGLWVCLFGQMLQSKARREAFHLVDLGGKPPYAVAVTAAGACKQKGKRNGFYTLSYQADPAERWQRRLVPLLLAASAVLAGTVCLHRQEFSRFLWVWSALLTVATPLSLPLTGTLPLYWLNRRLTRSGSAVAGYSGAKLVSQSKRMVLTDDDLFPPGTVGLNGLKVYGEEIGKVVSYAATVAKAANSPLSPLFEQLLASEGGFHTELQDLHFYEDGGVGGTIRGESVTMGSAYFMKKHKVNLPRELKVKTGVFLAVDSHLIAIFAIQYQPSRNVEWALRAIRRSRVQPVLATRSENITPGLLHRKFNLDVKPVYPDISTRLALSDLSSETVQRAGALIYREGLMPFAETVIGSHRMLRAVRLSTILCYVGGIIGLLLVYYLACAGSFALLTALRLLLFLLLWLIPTWLLSGIVKHF